MSKSLYMLGLRFRESLSSANFFLAKCEADHLSYIRLYVSHVERYYAPMINTFKRAETKALFNRQSVARFDTETAKDTPSAELAKIKPWGSSDSQTMT